MWKRALGLFVVMLLLFGGVLLRLYQLSLLPLTGAVLQQSRSTVTAGQSRGTIYDANLHPLVNTEYEYRLTLTAQPEALAALSSILDEDAFSDLTDRLLGGKPITVTLPSLIGNVRGTALFQVPIRYKEPLLAPHLLGYLDSTGQTGVTGIELAFNDRLSSYSGTAEVTYTVDGSGQVLAGYEPVVENTLNKAAGGVVLTIDAEIQALAEECAKEHLKKGAVVVLEPSTGYVRAMVSVPDFQPSTVAELLEDADSPLMNRAISNYNLGSVFKLVSAAAALESGVPESTEFLCEGSVTVGDTTIHCHNRLGHGVQDMRSALMNSCNSYFILLAQQMGSEPLYQTAVNLGFDGTLYLCDGIKTSRAVMPSAEQLSTSPGTLANMSFGQGDLMATPMHIAQLTAAIVNGGTLVRPTVLKGFLDADENYTAQDIGAISGKVFSAQTAELLRSMMIDAVKDGTGSGAKPSMDGAGGKTGTAETGWVVDGEKIEQSWFAGFYPAYSPRYVVVVLAEDFRSTNASTTAAFRDICDGLFMLERHRSLE